MKIEFLPGTKSVRLVTENTSDVFLLGKLAAKLRSSHHSSTGENHALECDQQDFLKLTLDACKP